VRAPGRFRTGSWFRAALLLPTDGSCREDELERGGAPALTAARDAMIEVSTSARSSAGRNPGREPSGAGFLDRVKRLRTHPESADIPIARLRRVGLADRSTAAGRLYDWAPTRSSHH
jgi:hypothetical protein